MSITMIGLDTAKSVFQVHAVDGAGQVVTRRKLQGVSKTWGAMPRVGLPGGQSARPALRP